MPESPESSDAENRDRSAVARAANDVRDAVENYGYEALISGVYGHDVARSNLEQVRARLKKP